MNRNVDVGKKYPRALLDEVPIGLALCDMTGSIVDINVAYAEIIGREIEETKKLTYWEITPEKYSAQEDEQLQNLQKTGRYGPYEKEYIHKDGHLVPVRLQGVILNLDGEDYIWSSIEDITEVKQTHKILELAKDEAVKANMAKSQFLSSMSHELRTPLNAIIGFAQLLSLDKNQFTDDQYDSINEISLGGKHLLKLISEILDFAKIESGKFTVNMRNVSLQKIVDECLSVITPIANEKSLKINFESAKDYILYADETRLKQILLNYLSNAVKYNKDNGSINLTFTDIDGQRLKVTVTDTGIGLSDIQIDKLFIPFERVGAEDTVVAGAGIGLVISKELVELMGGRVGVESQAGVGSSFWFELILANNQVKIISDTSIPQLEITEDDLQNIEIKTLLYIDDNTTNVRMMQYAFEVSGTQYNYISSTDPEQGLKLANDVIPDLILLDIKMPVMDGYEVLRFLRGDPKTEHIPVIAVSANAMAEDIEKGYAAGFDAYITKPIDMSDTIAKIKKLLAQN